MKRWVLVLGRRKSSSPEPGQPMFCDTTAKALGGGSYIDCYY